MVFFTSPDATTLRQHSTTFSVWLLPTGGIQHLHAVLHTKNTAGKDKKANVLFLRLIGYCKHTFSSASTTHYTQKSPAQVDYINKSPFLTVCHFPL